MDFTKIKEDIKGISFASLRMDCDNNFEAVVVREELERLTCRLEEFFGLPVFPSKNRLSLQIRQTVESYGGILPGQTLYFSNGSEGTVFAMLWPWKDGKRTTLKIIKK
ncbi:MAG TPA: hypothetical protein VMD04_00975 [Candidatus Margulisiibacteriota bacterium]|nr:hypothetical protein [Candidatus Margulisiibacteriota bacterium]